jgi:hypothetical protein
MSLLPLTILHDAVSYLSFFPGQVTTAFMFVGADRRSLAASNTLARFMREAIVPSEHCRRAAASW